MAEYEALIQNLRSVDEYDTGYAKLIYDAADAIAELSEERKTGRWILSEIQRQEDIENNNYQYYCSNCGSGDLHAKGMIVPYCWHCGAKMIGGDDDVL